MMQVIVSKSNYLFFINICGIIYLAGQTSCYRDEVMSRHSFLEDCSQSIYHIIMYSGNLSRYYFSTAFQQPHKNGDTGVG